MSKLEDMCILRFRKNEAGVPTEFCVHDCVCRWEMDRQGAEERRIWIFLAASVVAGSLSSIDAAAGAKLNEVSTIKHCLKMINAYVEDSERDDLEGPSYMFKIFCAPRFGLALLNNGFHVEAEHMLITAVDQQRVIQGSDWPKERESLILMKCLSQTWLKMKKPAEAFELLQDLYKWSLKPTFDSDDLAVWPGARLRELREDKNATANNRYQALNRTSGKADRSPKPILGSEESRRDRTVAVAVDNTYSSLPSSSARWADPITELLRDFDRRLLSGRISDLAYLRIQSSVSDTEISNEEWGLVQRFENLLTTFGMGHPETHAAKQGLLDYYDSQDMFIQAEELRGRRVGLQRVTNESGRTELIEKLQKRPSMAGTRIGSGNYNDFQEAIDQDFITLAFKDDFDNCHSLLLLGANVNAQSATGDTALHHDISGRYWPFISLILDEGYDISLTDAKNMSALQCMMALGSHGARFYEQTTSLQRGDMQKLLCKVTARLYNLPLIRDRWHLMLRAAAHDADIGLLYDLFSTTIDSKLAITPEAVLMAGVVGETQFVIRGLALWQTGKAPSLRDCLEFTAIIAGIMDQDEMLEMLAAAGVNLEACCPRLEISPLMAVCQFGQTDSVMVLLLHGVAVNTVQTKLLLTPLYMACLRGNQIIIVSLVQAGADVNSQNGPSGETPLQCAERRGGFPKGWWKIVTPLQAIERPSRTPSTVGESSNARQNSEEQSHELIETKNPRRGMKGRWKNLKGKWTESRRDTTS